MMTAIHTTLITNIVITNMAPPIPTYITIVWVGGRPLPVESADSENSCEYGVFPLPRLVVGSSFLLLVACVDFSVCSCVVASLVGRLLAGGEVGLVEGVSPSVGSFVLVMWLVVVSGALLVLWSVVMCSPSDITTMNNQYTVLYIGRLCFGVK